MLRGTTTSGIPAAEDAATRPVSGSWRLGHFLRSKRDLLGLTPFFAYLVIFLVVPSASVIASAFSAPAGHSALSNISASLHGVYLVAYEKSLELAGLSAAFAGIAGTIVAVALVSCTRPSVDRLVATACGVLANTGGLPLAFAFIASYGPLGIVTHILAEAGWSPYDHGFSILSFSGLVLVYCYFLIPLMVLVMVPPLEALRREWFEAASTLGAGRLQAWRLVALPLIGPSFFAALMVLFTDAFAAYATAAVMTQGTIPIVPIEIGTLVQGNVVSGQQNVGDALGLGMIVIVLAVAAVYAALQRKVARWQR